MKEFIVIVGSILLGLALFTMLMKGDNSLLGTTKQGMQKNIEYINQIP